MSVIPYSQFRPTQFDSHIPLEGREDWLLVPVGRTRDSGVTDESNFCVAHKLLGEDSELVEVHRFGHWGPGWFEVLIAHPSLRAHVEEISAKLDRYPLLDEDDHSSREWDQMAERWGSMSLRERVEALSECDISIFQARQDALGDVDDLHGKLFEYLRAE